MENVESYVADGSVIVQTSVDSKKVILSKNIAEEIFIKTEDNKSNCSVVETKNLQTIMRETIKANNEIQSIFVDAKTIDASIFVKSKEIKEKDATEAEKQVIAEFVKAKKDDLKVAMYLDITNGLKINKKVIELDTLKGNVQLKIDVPTHLPKIAEGYIRVYKVVRNHKGKVEELQTKTADGKIMFITDKSSKYAIYYEDAKLPPNVAVNVTIGFLVLFGAYAILKFAKESITKNKE